MTVNIGIVGCGGIAEYHAGGYLKLGDEAKIIAVCDVVKEKATELSKTVGDAKVFTDLQDMLALEELDAIDICLPHAFHKDAIVAAARAGKHVMCEKPLCLSEQEASEIMAATRESGIMLMCAHNQLFSQAVQKAKQLLEEGTLGRIYEIRTVDTFYHPWGGTGMGWRSSRATMGGGELIDTGYHPTYTLLYLSSAAPVEVTAMLSQHRIQMDGEDSAQVLVRFADGSVGNIVSSWAYERPEGWPPFTVIGEKGQLYPRGNDLCLSLRDAEETVFPFEKVNTFDEETADFVRCVRDGRAPMQNELDGIRVLRVILGAYESDTEKRTVRLAADAS